jgi:integrase
MQALMRQHGLPGHLLRPLTYGLIEAAIRGWEILEQRTLGTAPLILTAEAEEVSAPSVLSVNQASGTKATKQSAAMASSMVEEFGDWGRTSGGWRAGAEGQAEASVRLFLEVCGDRPADDYPRTDGDKFRTTLRRLPSNYRKSPRDRSRPIAEIITEADAKETPRIGDKTVKRHFWALSQFFVFLVETGRVPKDTDNPGRGFTFNTRGSVRKQRDMWSGDELRRLFASPVWTGCHPYFRARRGEAVIRDAMFWLPLLGLFHGNRLEEFAQLRRGDVAQVDGVWSLSITDADGRQLKNEQSRRVVPLHPELIRIGFLDYVSAVTTRPQDQVFPELLPGGKDRKLGYYFSKKFSAYRAAIGVRRRGLDYHSFRHSVTTKLYEANVSEAWVDILTGHDEEGGESRRRYLKGIPMPQLRSSIELVVWPELDLSPHYTRDAGDERWPATGGKGA